MPQAPTSAFPLDEKHHLTTVHPSTLNGSGDCQGFPNGDLTIDISNYLPQHTSAGYGGYNAFGACSHEAVAAQPFVEVIGQQPFYDITTQPSNGNHDHSMTGLGTQPLGAYAPIMSFSHIQPPPLLYSEDGLLLPQFLPTLTAQPLTVLESLYDSIGVPPQEIDMRLLAPVLRHLDQKGKWSKAELALDAKRLRSQDLVRHAMPGRGHRPAPPNERILRPAPPPCPVPVYSDHRFDPTGLRAEEWLELDICNAFTYGAWHLGLVQFSHRVRFALLRWQFKVWDKAFRNEKEERDGRQPRAMRMQDVNYIFTQGEEDRLVSSAWNDPLDPAADDDLSERFRKLLIDWRHLRGRNGKNGPLNVMARRILKEWQRDWNRWQMEAPVVMVAPVANMMVQC